MKEEETKVGDIRVINNKPEICVQLIDFRDGVRGSEWKDYEDQLLHTRMGMSPESHQLHTLQYFVDALNQNKPQKEKESHKIRYAFIVSPTTLRIDPRYKETLGFKVLTLEELEKPRGTLNYLLTDGGGSIIKLLGRDRCTERKDIGGCDIYENDILRWFPYPTKVYREVLVKYESNRFILDTWYGDNYLDTEKHCKVIGNIYENPDWEANEK